MLKIRKIKINEEIILEKYLTRSCPGWLELRRKSAGGINAYMDYVHIKLKISFYILF